MRYLLAVALLAALFAHSQENLQIDDLERFTHPKLGLQIIGGNVMLPYGDYRVESTELGPAFLMPAATIAAERGERYRAIVHQRQLEQDAYDLQSPFFFTREEEDYHEKALAELLQSGRFAVLPNVRLEGFNANVERQLYVVEIAPRFDDGKHYVLYNTGMVERIPIDQELLDRHQLKITPQQSGTVVSLAGPTSFRFVAQILPDTPTTVRIKLSSGHDEMGSRLSCVLDVPAATDGQEVLFTEWATQRIGELALIDYWYPTVVLDQWQRIYAQAYSVKDLPASDRNDANIPTTMAILGGRAALRETLQLQNLRTQQSIEERTIDIGAVPGVQVKSHPYEQMLAGTPGGSLPIADLVPRDRFFVYFAQPRTMMSFLDYGQEFLRQTGALTTRSDLRYDLADDYFSHLGLTEEWVRMLLEQDVVEEIGLCLPDLFLIDGTEITAIVRIQGLQAMIAPLLRLAGVTGLSDGAISEKQIDGERRSYWAMSGNWLLIGTRREEVQRVLDLAADSGESLGRSAEFRYMLTKMPLDESTEAFVYFSDAFIRRLVGPEMKIGQLRRLQAKADMEALTAAALLYRADGYTEPLTRERLAGLGFIDPRLAGPDYMLDDDLRTASRLWGRPGAMSTLLERPVRKITVTEQEEYGLYVQAYSRFWQQFFDPIAIRINRRSPLDRELELFILPLVANSLYNQTREILATMPGAPPLRAPIFSPEAVLTASFNLKDPAWQMMLSQADKVLESFSVDPAILDELGPSIHVAIKDADPIITFGSGDLFGVMDMSGRGMGRQAMVMLPIFASLLTRPAHVAIDLRDPGVVAGMLHAAALSMSPNADHDVHVDLTQVGNDSSWMLTLSVAGLLKLRYGIEVKGNYLLLSNVPWTQWETYAGERVDLLASAAISVMPRAGSLQLPSLHAAAMESQGDASRHGMAHLLPLMMAGAESVDEAQKLHQRLFGFYPAHPQGGNWSWRNGMMTSDRFGTFRARRQPKWSPEQPFGLLRDIDTLTLSMQLEDDGLRSRLTWRLRAPSEK